MIVTLINEVGFGAIEKLARSLKFSTAFAAVYTLVILIVFIVTVLRIAFLNYKENQKGYTFKSFVEIAKPLLPFYIIISALPFLLTFIDFSISYVFDQFGTFSDNAYGAEEINKLIKDRKNYYTKEIKEIYADSSIGYFADIQVRWLKIIKGVEIWILKGVGELMRYLFTFAICIYFAWVLVLDVFAPIGGAGLIYKEFKNFGESWLKNMIASRAFLAMIIIGDLLSIGIYKIYREIGDYNLFIHILFLIMLRGYLYRNALNLSKSIL